MAEKKNKKEQDEQSCIVMEIGYVTDEWSIDPSIIPVCEEKEDDDELKPL